MLYASLMPILANFSEITQPVAPLCCIYLRCFIQVNKPDVVTTNKTPDSAVCYPDAKQIKILLCATLPQNKLNSAVCYHVRVTKHQLKLIAAATVTKPPSRCMVVHRQSSLL